MADEYDVLDEEEERAAAICTRPIEEILGIREEEPEDDWDDEDDDSTVDNAVDNTIDNPVDNNDEDKSSA
jgi:hypothetical protein